MANHILPNITQTSDILQRLQTWRITLQNALRQNAPARQPQVPFNFQATNARGGITLSWAAVPGADGYEIQSSSNGDFSTANIVVVGSQAQTSLFDSLGGPPTTRYYRIRSTAGTANAPHSVKGSWSASITHRSIDTTDTGTTPTTHVDNVTSDQYRSQSRYTPLPI